MPHNIDLILTLAGGLGFALVLGFITQKLRLSPIVGYLLAGVVVGPHSPGFVADAATASQFAEIGVILLMFGVGLHFHLKDLMAVRKVALPGAVAQILLATLLGAAVTWCFDWPLEQGIVYGMAISVASTVVLTRVLADNRALHTPTGHIAVGWLIVEDLFTILALVLLPAITGAFRNGEAGAGGLWTTLGLTLLKLGALVVFTLVVGQKVIPKFLGYVARTGTRDLFTLAVLALAIGIAVGSAEFFSASMALGAFLAGMVVGQSDFSARAAAEALPMRDAFAVLFFVSVGMLFDPASLARGWPLMLATLAVVLVGKSAAAVAVVLLLKKPLHCALSVAVALAQIGEFSFILAAVAANLGLLPPQAAGALVVTAVVSITLNPLLFKLVDPATRWLEAKGWAPRRAEDSGESMPPAEDKHRVVLVGYGPVGRILGRILRENNIEVVVIDMNLDTVQTLRAEGRPAVFGDATSHEILRHAGVESAEGLIVSSFTVAAREVIQAAKELNPALRVFTHTTYLREAEALCRNGATAVFSGEGEVALSMAVYLLKELGATAEQVDNERRRIREEFFSSTCGWQQQT